MEGRPGAEACGHVMTDECPPPGGKTGGTAEDKLSSSLLGGSFLYGRNARKALRAGRRGQRGMQDE